MGILVIVNLSTGDRLQLALDCLPAAACVVLATADHGLAELKDPARAFVRKDLRALGLERPPVCRGRAEPAHREVPDCLRPIEEETVGR